MNRFWKNMTAHGRVVFAAMAGAATTVVAYVGVEVSPWGAAFIGCFALAALSGLHAGLSGNEPF